MKNAALVLREESGFVLVTALVIMLLLIVIGTTMTITTSIETKITGNERRYNMAFYAAEAARSYVQGSTDLYGSTNTVVGEGKTLAAQNLGTKQSFDSFVEYEGGGTPPRGTPFSAGGYSAHYYTMTCNGYVKTASGSTLAESQVSDGFYRIGF